jgi:hypothetical protein
MNGKHAAADTIATDFVIVTGEGTNTKAWTAPRSWARSKYSGWTFDPDSAFVYRSRQSVERAIERYQRRRRIGFEQAQYCTYGEWLRLLKGETL